MSPLLLPFPFMLVILVVGDLFLTASALCGNHSNGCSSGDSFSYPFSYYIDGDFSYGDCGYSALSVNCFSYGRPVMNISNIFYYVTSNDPQRQRLRVVGVDVDEAECPRPTQNFTLQTTSPFKSPYDGGNDGNITYFYNCSSGYPKDVTQKLPCLDTYSTNSTTTGLLHSFAFSTYDHLSDDGFNWLTRNCQESVVVPSRTMINGSDYKVLLKLGFDLHWSTPAECKGCENSGGQCWYNETAGIRHACSCPEHGTNGTERRIFDEVCPIQTKNNTTSPGATENTSQSKTQIGPTNVSQQNTRTGIPTAGKIVLGLCSAVGALILFILFIYRRKFSSVYASTVSHWKPKIKSSTDVEAFLERCGCLGLQRYRYSEVKKMTNNFKEKLGQGGFGSVFKGKLPDGHLVAVKVLNKSRGNGEDFMNEVATIGWTNHVNVVRLLGFCSKGNKQALVYEFMPNGSLEKFIYNREKISVTNPPLGLEKLYQISLGIARGLEYLHRGCNIRILHFDIKPHNILLDRDFCPKIADFGLAKLCETRESIVSMHLARGTMGYIAPEVACINFGGVSHKSDVYSYGMMILEMIGGRKNVDTTVENISEIYFPQWIYNHIIHDADIDEHNEIFKEETIRKMIIVALHCIQTQPTNRPSISKVVEMLEGNVDELQMPLSPFQDPPSLSP